MSYQLDKVYDLVGSIAALPSATACVKPATLVGGNGELYSPDALAPTTTVVKNGITYPSPVAGVWSAPSPLITVTNPNPCKSMRLLWYREAYVSYAVGGLIQVEIEVDIDGAGMTPQFYYNPPSNVNSGSANEYILGSLEFPQVSALTVPPGGTKTITGRIRYVDLAPGVVQTVYVMAVSNTLYGVI